MATVSGTFVAAGVSATLAVNAGDEVTLAISGTYAATVWLERASSPAELSWIPVRGPFWVANATVGASYVAEQNDRLRVRCTARTSGTVTYSLVGAVKTAPRTGLIVPFHAAASTTVTNTDTAAAAAFYATTPRVLQFVDLTGFTEGRLCVHLGSVAGAAGTFLRMNYAITYPATAAALLPLGETSEIQVALDQAVSAVYVSAWLPIIGPARRDVLLGLTTIGGDGVVDPQIYNVTGQFR
jgi:hypothetical protein